MLQRLKRKTSSMRSSALTTRRRRRGPGVMIDATKAKTAVITLISTTMMMMMMMATTTTRLQQAAAQETFVVADHEYESLRTHYEPIQASQTCLLSLPEIVSPHAAGAPYSHSTSAAARSPVCITQRDVELALNEAANSIKIAPALRQQGPPMSAPTTSERPYALQLVAAAELIAQTTRILASSFHLTEHEILYELPKISASTSPALAGVCPDFLVASHGQCLPDDQPLDAGKFRSLSGYCNNPHQKSWGAARSAMVRFLEPDYRDAVWAPRAAVDGSPLPSARVVSFVLHQEAHECDQRHSMLGVVWGQFINHDMNLGVRVTDEDELSRNLNCCDDEMAPTGQYRDSYREYRLACDCLPIEIPKGDPFYGYFNQKCMNFVRLSPSLQTNCALGPVHAMNKHSSYIDGSSIYGTNSITLKRLRAHQGGLLRSQPVPTSTPTTLTTATATAQTTTTTPTTSAHYPEASTLDAVASALTSGSVLPAVDANAAYLMLVNEAQQTTAPAAAQPLFKDLLPSNEWAPDVGCERRNRPQNLYCFDAGDTRANEQIQLASLHTIMMREHNRLATQLAAINPHWPDERLFQEARKIVSAQIQHLTYGEFLPLVLGKEAIHEYGLELASEGQYFHGYDSKLNGGIRVEFQAAAFRYGHSQVPGLIERYNKFHEHIESVRLSKLLKQPFDLYYPGVLDTYIMGLADQQAGRMDASLTSEVANHLFEKPGNFFGLDLAAINVQRAREMGVRGYNSYRAYCNLPQARGFAEYAGVFNNRTLFRMAQVYKHVDDIDLFTGGVSEYPVPGALVGPTFRCLIAKQAAILRSADRFWYENPHQFTLEQLDEIRRQTSARLLCDNSDDLLDIQTNAMLMADAQTNPRVACNSLPSLDMTKWKEDYSNGYTNNNHHNHRADTPDQRRTESRLTYDSGNINNELILNQIDNNHGQQAVDVNGLGLTPNGDGSSSSSNRVVGPLAVHNQGHLTLLVRALQQYQKNQHQHEQQQLHGPLRTFSHIVDHLVDTSNYRNQPTHK